MIEKNYYTREQWSLNRNRSQKVLLTWHATISRIHRSTNERQSSHENAPSFNASHKVTFLLFLPVSSTLPNFSPSTNRQTEWNQNKCTRITRKKTHERDGHGPSPRGSTQLLLLRRPLKRRYRLGVLIFSRLVTRLAKTIKQTSSEREREKERKERIKFSNEQKEKKKKKNNKIKSTTPDPRNQAVSLLSFERIFRRKRERGKKRSIIENDHRWWWNRRKNDRSTTSSRSAIWENGPEIFPSFPLSLSLYVCVIDQSMWMCWKFYTYDEFYYEAGCFARERAKMKEKWSSCVSVVRGGVRIRVSWLCFFRAGATSESAERWTLTKSDG